MFAYCNNAPVCLVDDDGTDPYGTLTIVDYYFIHRMVQEEVSKTYGWKTEVTVYYDNRKWGRLDLYDSMNNSFYEVKSANFARLRPGSVKKQMKRYKENTVSISGFPGKSNPSPGEVTIKQGTITYGKYTFTYYSSPTVQGLILYEELPSDQINQEQPAIYPNPALKKEHENQSSFPVPSPHPVPAYYWVIIPPIGNGLGGGGWNINDILHYQMA